MFQLLLTWIYWICHLYCKVSIPWQQQKGHDQVHYPRSFLKQDRYNIIDQVWIILEDQYRSQHTCPLAGSLVAWCVFELGRWHQDVTCEWLMVNATFSRQICIILSITFAFCASIWSINQNKKSYIAESTVGFPFQFFTIMGSSRRYGTPFRIHWWDILLSGKYLVINWWHRLFTGCTNTVIFDQFW